MTGFWFNGGVSMDAELILNKIRQRGVIITAVGNLISLVPIQLVNDRMIIFIRKHKNELLTALYQEKYDHQIVHNHRKSTLRQSRLEVLRILLWRFLNNVECRLEVHNKAIDPLTDKMVEDYLDSELMNLDYQLEDIIDGYRLLGGEMINQPVQNMLCNCGYRAPFCVCISLN